MAAPAAESPETAHTIADLVRRRAEDDNVALIHGLRSWTWREVVAASAARRRWLSVALDPDRPPHVGILLPNGPEFVFQIFAAALGGTCVVGLNATRRGAELRRDVERSACQFVLSDASYADLLDDAVRVEDEPWRDHDGAPLPSRIPPPDELLFLLFTSGSTGDPKAAKCSQRRLAGTAGAGFTRDDVLYCPMPLSHGNALSATLFPALAGGSTLVLRDRFSAGAWLADVRAHGVTFTSTVGRALGYVLATDPTPHDRAHQLRAVLAPEASPRDSATFEQRFGVKVVSGYGSSEGGIVLLPADKPGALGVAPEHADVAVVDAEGAECEIARFDSRSRMCNADRAIGELVRRDAVGSFEGYWDDPEAQADRVRNGWFWSGDLAYRDADGVFWFAGRTGDWLRVDSENFAAAPIERIVGRYPVAVAVAVVGVPDPLAGDQVMAVLELMPGRTFDPAAFADFLASQPDLGTKWAPRFVRIVAELPVASNGKIDKKPIRARAWLTDDDVWWRPPRSTTYRLVSQADRDALRDAFLAHGRLGAHP